MARNSRGRIVNFDNANSSGLLEVCGGSHVLAEILWRRGVRSEKMAEQWLNPNRYWGTAPEDLLYSEEEVGTFDSEQKRKPDVYLKIDQVVPQLLRGLYRLAPFNSDRPEPIFGSETVHLVNVTGEGLSKHSARLIIEDEFGNQLRAIWSGMDPRQVPNGMGTVIFRLRIDDRMGREEVRVEILDFLMREEPDNEVSESNYICPIIDHRKVADPLGLVNLLKDVQVWAEGDSSIIVECGLRRDQLQQGGELVIWSRPPNPEVLRTVVSYVQPHKIQIFAPPFTELKKTAFLHKLASLTKGVLRQRNGKISVAEFTGRMGVTEALLCAGLELLTSRGLVSFRVIEERVLLEKGDGEPRFLEDRRVDGLLEEIAAYQRYIGVADLGEILGNLQLDGCRETPHMPLYKTH